MKSSHALRRLLRIRALQEEQSRLALETAQAEQKRLDAALAESRRSERRSRESIFAGVRSGDAVERIAGIMQSFESERASKQIAAWKLEADLAAARLRKAFLADRTERRQTERMVEAAAAEATAQEERSAQKALDDWHRMQGPSAKKEAARPSMGAKKSGGGSATDDVAEPDRPF